MMMNFRQNKPKTRKIFWIGILLVLILVFSMSENVSHFFSSIGFSFTKPFFNLGASINNWTTNQFVVFYDKKDLEQENKDLKEKINEMQANLLSLEILENENKELKNLLSRTDEDQYIIGYVLSRPPQSPYDILIADIGSKNNIEEGMEVTAYGNILIGYVSEVFSKTSKIKMISFSKNETNAVLLNLNIPVIAIGQGNGNFEIELPKDVEIQQGEKVVTLGEKPLLLGIVEKIESSPTDPFQKIYFRTPINIQELKHIMIKI